MNQYLSDKLRVLSFVSVIMVVFIHSHHLKITYTSRVISLGGSVNAFLQNIISEGIARVAVPLFFAISGYLFFLGMKGGWHEFAAKFKRRIKSLLVPYLLWSAWAILLYALLQQLPQSKPFFTQGLIADYTLIKWLDTLFFNPIPYQFWFLQSLMMLVLCSPMLYYVLKYLGAWLLLPLFILWSDLFRFTFIIFSSEAILFFSIGAWLALHKSRLLTVRVNNRQWSYWFTLAWLCLVVLKSLLMHYQVQPALISLLVHKACVVVGLLALWVLYDYLMLGREKPVTWLMEWSGYAFFIFAFHEPVLTMVKKGLFYFLGGSEVMSGVNYVMVPLITIGLAIPVAMGLRKAVPVFYATIAGGR